MNPVLAFLLALLSLTTILGLLLAFMTREATSVISMIFNPIVVLTACAIGYSSR